MEVDCGAKRDAANMGVRHEASGNMTMPIHVSWFLPVQHCDFNRMPASVWIRCLQLLPYLERRHIHSQINQSHAETQIAAFVRFQDADACELALREKAAGRKVLFDLCVNYFDETGLIGKGYGTTRERVAETMRMIQIADVVTCASEAIARRAHDVHQHVVYLPDSIDLHHFHYTKPVDDFFRLRLRAIWSGVATKAYELEPILPLLRQRHIDLMLITDQPPTLTVRRWLGRQRMPYHFFPWRYETFPANILEGEICVSYRAVDTPYNQGHSFFKIGVFLAQGIPALASPVPSYVEAFGVAPMGHVCHSLQEWKQMLDAVVEDRDLLRTWTQYTNLFRERYSTETIIEDYQKIFQTLCL